MHINLNHPVMIHNISRYFPHLTPTQISQLEGMMRLYPEWNAKINVISRKDIDNLEVNHILHSLSIAKFISFSAGSRILDLGCGGGLPGLPLAVMFPEANFYLIDRIGKKIKVAQAIAEELHLENVEFKHGDASEAPKRAFDFVVSRAVMQFCDLMKAALPHISRNHSNGYPNGLITLKGGELQSELGRYKHNTIIQPLSDYFPTISFFKTKLLTYTPVLA